MGKRGAPSGSNAKGKQASSAFPAAGGGFPSHLLVPEEQVPESTTSGARTFSPEPPPAQLQTLLPGYIWVIPNFFTHPECKNWIDFVEREVPMEHTVQRGTRFLAQRECYRTSRNDPTLSERVFRRLLHRVFQLQRKTDSLSEQQKNDISSAGLPPGCPDGCNPNLRLYKYTKGHSFGKHVDESVALPDGSRTRLTALVYLSNCQGGATRFYDPRGSGVAVSFQPTVGALLLHLHGDDCLEHEGDMVTGGTKYVLRTDVAYRRP
jgi:2OG-Fe(II) oxygenase superfamily